MSERWKECWDTAPDIYVLLRESANLSEARERIIGYLESLEWMVLRGISIPESWDYILFKEAVRTLKNIISPRYESMVEFSTLEPLWTAAVEGECDVAEDFIEEFVHLFKALKFQADVYPSMLMKGIEQPDYEKYEGREAALHRSSFLDRMGKRMDHFLRRYPSGLRPDVAKRRIENRDKILEVLEADSEDWLDWRWQYRCVFKDREDLELIERIIEISPEHHQAIELAMENQIPFGVTPHYLHLMDPQPSDMDYAVRCQVFPPLAYVQNMIAHKTDRRWAFDFMREADTSPVDLVTRRYPRVAIMKPYESCPQICVYCQRNWEITSPFMPSALASWDKIEDAIGWFAEHEEMMDVLVTGGDPLVLNDGLIDDILRRLSQIDHLRSIRVATRTIVTVPQRISPELCEIMASYHELGRRNICVVTHLMHPYEITPETLEAAKRIRLEGMQIYNQQVFTFANSRRFETDALRIAIKDIGIDPYYTFNMKGKAEMEEYAVPIARILQERKEEARLLPGIFRTDEPVFNVPFLGKDHLRAWQNHELIAIRSDGRRIYSFFPWEKNVMPVKPYVYTDVTLLGYLRRVEARGEDPQDYMSIWYYY